MPTYTYRCKNCKQIEEVFHSMNEEGLKDKECDVCKKGLFERVIGTPAFAFSYGKGALKQVQKMEDTLQKQRNIAKSVGLYDG